MKDAWWCDRLPEGFPIPQTPLDNPMTQGKVALGRHLFYDKRLSWNGAQSCASCHLPELAFSDGLARSTGSTGSTGDELPRNAMALVNVAFNDALTWSNPALSTLEAQVLVPLFAEEPVEMGLTGHEEDVLARLAADSRYQTLFSEAFPDSEGERFTIDHVVKALTSFVRSLLGDSPFDRFTYHGEPSLSPSAIRGMSLFYSERLECHHCHGGFNFSSTSDHGLSPSGATYHNTGLYNLNGEGGYPGESRGLIDITGLPQDMGRFRAPTLRNIERTAPYMHDGSIETLEGVIRHYEAGGRTITGGASAGVGHLNPYKSSFVSGFTLSDEERADLIEFLKSLTDEGFLNDPALGDPWGPDVSDWSSR